MAPAASTAFGLGKRRSLRSAALALAVVFPLASAVGLRIYASSKTPAPSLCGRSGGKGEEFGMWYMVGLQRSSKLAQKDN